MTNRGASASRDRATVDQVLAQLGKVRAEKRVAAALDAVGELTAVLNGQRQIVFANRAFLDFAAAADPEGVCGKRTGEVFGCTHAESTPGGCGTADECGLCGAAGAVLETQRTGRAAKAEFHVDSNGDGRRHLVEFLVRTTPFEIDGEVFTLLAMSDVSQEKRRSALERVFFHDILNTASGLRAYVDLLKATATDPETRPLVVRLEAICATLVEEIEGQKILVSAENGTLTLRRDLIESIALVRQVAELFEAQEVAKGKTIRVAAISESVAFVSDDSLVRRILGNMVKNALEACRRDCVVSIGCERAAAERGGVRLFVHNPTSMPAEVQQQVFRRYYSTKGPDRGLGTYGMKLLGEEYLGGEVRFESTEAEGTMFFLLLPESPPGFGGASGS